MRDLFAFQGQVFSPDGAVDVDPENVDEHNAATTQLQVDNFKSRRFDRCFAYWHDPSPEAQADATIAALGKIPSTITTWTGQMLATVTWAGIPYKCPAFGFHSIRRNFRARGIDGRDWYGIYYVSSGNYVRMRACKAT